MTDHTVQLPIKESENIDVTVQKPVVQASQKKKAKVYFNLEQFKEWLAMLRAQYPLAFPEKKRIPLAIGIFHNIAEVLNVPKSQVRAFMRWYTQNKEYLKNQISGAPRLNLAGEVVGAVTDIQMNYAQGKLANKINRLIIS